MNESSTEPLGDHSFYWEGTGTMGYLNLHDKTHAEAVKIATERGYRPWCWYRPSTWDNQHRAYYGDGK